MPTSLFTSFAATQCPSSCNGTCTNVITRYKTIPANKYLRSIEYKHFEPYNQKIQEMPKTVISYEYNDPWNEDKDSFYPLGDERNNNVYLKYNQLAEEEKKIVFRGRLGTYKYYDMQDIIKDVFEQFGM